MRTSDAVARDLEALAPGLASLVAAATADSVAQAAFALRVHPSTLTRKVSRLQTALGMTLFERQGRMLRITEEGRHLASSARTCLDALSVVLEQMHGSRESVVRPVRLGLVETLSAELIPEALAAFRVDHGELTSVRIVHGDSVELAERLVSGEVDLALATPVFDPAGLQSVEVMRDRLEVVVPVEHPLAVAGAADIADLDGESLVMLEVRCGARQVVDELAAESGVELDVAFETGDAALARGFVSAGLGIAVLPAVDGPLQGGLVAVPLGDARAYRSVHLVWSTERPLPDETAALRDFLQGALPVLDLAEV